MVRVMMQAEMAGRIRYEGKVARVTCSQLGNSTGSFTSASRVTLQYLGLNQLNLHCSLGRIPWGPLLRVGDRGRSRRNEESSDLESPIHALQLQRATTIVMPKMIAFPMRGIVPSSTQILAQRILGPMVPMR